MNAISLAVLGLFALANADDTTSTVQSVLVTSAALSTADSSSISSSTAKPAFTSGSLASGAQTPGAYSTDTSVPLITDLPTDSTVTFISAGLTAHGSAALSKDPKYLDTLATVADTNKYDDLLKPEVGSGARKAKRDTSSSSPTSTTTSTAAVVTADNPLAGFEPALASAALALETKLGLGASDIRSRFLSGASSFIGHVSSDDNYLKTKAETDASEIKSYITAAPSEFKSYIESAPANVKSYIQSEFQKGEGWLFGKLEPKNYHEMGVEDDDDDDDDDDDL